MPDRLRERGAASFREVWNEMKKEEKICCPSCGREIQMDKPKAYLYGTPFRPCEACGGEYVDKRYHEIAVDGIYVGHKLYIPAWQVLATVAALALLAYSMSSYAAWYFGFTGMVVFFALGVFASVLMICMDISALQRYVARKKRLAALKEESAERVKNPAYVEKLESLGWKVRSEYLPDELKAEPEEIEPVFSDKRGEHDA